MAASSEAGDLWLSDGTIQHRGPCGQWAFPLSRLRLLGECTTDHGPLADDWFLCFAADADGWYEASLYGGDRNGFLLALGDELRHPLRPALASSTDYASRVLWPPHLEDRPMFDYAPAKPGSLFERLFGSGRIVQSFTREIRGHLEQPR